MSSQSATRGGVAGLGKMDMLHAAVFNSLTGSRLAAVAEISRLHRDVLVQHNFSR